MCDICNGIGCPACLDEDQEESKDLYERYIQEEEDRYMEEQY